MISFLKLTRAWNLWIIAFSQYLTALVFVGTQVALDLNLFVLIASTVMIAAGGYIINDYYDVKIDLVNKPDRVVIGKGITRRYAMLFHTMLSLTGVLAGFYLNWRIGVINLASAFLLWWYSNDLKRQPFIGNFVVALLTAIAILIIDALYLTGKPLIVTYGVFAFFMTLVREVIKDIEDLKGDETFGCKTLPIIWGIRRTKFFLYTLLVIFLSIVICLNIYFTKLPLYYFLLFLFPPLVWLTYRLVKADTKKEFGSLSTFCKVIMLLGILSMLFI